MKNIKDNTYSFFFRYSMILIFGIFILIQLKYVNFIPVWDGRWYLEAIHNALNEPFNLLSYSLGHSAFAYGFLIAFTQWIEHGSMVLFHILQIIIGCIGIFSFNKILKFIFKDKYRLELFLITVIYAIHPMILASSIAPTLDFPVTSFLLAMTAALLYEQYGLFLIFAIFSIFTREIGLTFYLTFITAYIVAYTIRQKHPFSKEFKRLIILIFPAILFFIFAIYKRFVGTDVLWGGESSEPSNIIKLFLRIDLTDPYAITHLLQVFVLNFDWIFTLFILLYLGGKYGIRLFSFIINKPLKYVHKPLDMEWKAFYILFFVFIINGFLLVNYKTYVIPRYRIVLIPLFLIFGTYCLLLLLQKRKNLRIILLSLIVPLFFIQNFYTIDKVSKDTFGTFEFGDHKMICMKRITNTEPDCGRDQIIYNLQYTNVVELANKAVNFMKPDNNGNIHIASTVFNNHQMIFANIDLNRKKITLKEGPGIINPIYYSLDYKHISDATVPVILLNDIPYSDNLPNRLYFIIYPMYGDEYYYLMQLQKRGYKINQRHFIYHNGYLLKFFDLGLSDS